MSIEKSIEKRQKVDFPVTPEQLSAIETNSAEVKAASALLEQAAKTATYGLSGAWKLFCDSRHEFDTFAKLLDSFGKDLSQGQTVSVWGEFNQKECVIVRTSSESFELPLTGKERKCHDAFIQALFWNTNKEGTEFVSGCSDGWVHTYWAFLRRGNELVFKLSPEDPQQT